jgi:hypothetical protein
VTPEQELAQLVLQLKIDEVENWWGRSMIRIKWTTEADWDRIRELAEQLREAR